MKDMKKKFVAIILTLIFALTACSGKEEEVEDTEINEEVTPTAVEEPDEVETEPEDEPPVIDVPDAGENEGGEEKTIEEQYSDILLKYKRIQDDRLTVEEVEKTGLTTELIQRAWPAGCTDDEVRYLFYDIDGNGTEELIIIYHTDIVDIYAYDGEKVRYAFGAPYRGISVLYPEGLLAVSVSYSAGDHSTIWYKFDTVLGDFFPSFEMIKNYDSDPEFYEFCGVDDSDRDEVEKAYRESGDYPVWVFEWGDTLTFDDYKERCPEGDPVKLPQGERLADFER